MHSNLTIIILTHNRPQYLERIINYYSNVEYKVLIADSSKKDCGTKIPSNFVYYHFENLDFFTKLDKIMQYVKTEYMLFCADDDFWVTESISDCIEFLESSPEYSSVQGNYIGFSGYERNAFIPTYLHAQSIESSSIEKRLATNMKNYMPLFYAMHRTEVMKKVFSDNHTTGISHAILNEVSVSLYSLMYGKHKKLEILTYARDDISDPTPVQRDNLKNIAVHDEFKDQFSQFKRNIVNVLNHIDSSLEGEIIVEQVLAIYINQVKDEKIWKFMFKKYFYFLLPIIRYLRSKRAYQIMHKRYSNAKGYPLSDIRAIQSWENIRAILYKYKV